MESTTTQQARALVVLLALPRGRVAVAMLKAGELPPLNNELDKYTFAKALIFRYQFPEKLDEFKEKFVDRRKFPVRVVDDCVTRLGPGLVFHKDTEFTLLRAVYKMIGYTPDGERTYTISEVRRAPPPPSRL